MHFWLRAEAFLAGHDIIIDRPRGSRHPRFPEFVYPLDYGYLKDTLGSDANPVDVWRGSLTGKQLVGVACTVDLMKSDAELKLLVDCSEEEIHKIETFYRDNQYLSGMIIRRGNT
jgi:inorganic pyrophosphatase